MALTIKSYNENQSPAIKLICDKLWLNIDKALGAAESKIWHGHPVWFINGNPIVGYSMQKKGLRLLFWSGADFNEDGLNIKGKKFMDASIFYKDEAQVNTIDLKRWLAKSKTIVWDYKNLIKRKGKLEKLS
jgi:uncharacterized protein YdhG (YjbR/CyaY superfamily)